VEVYIVSGGAEFIGDSLTSFRSAGKDHFEAFLGELAGGLFTEATVSAGY
jgi:hypothetical protein